MLARGLGGCAACRVHLRRQTAILPPPLDQALTLRHLARSSTALRHNKLTRLPSFSYATLLSCSRDAFHQGPYGGKGDDKKGGRRGGDRGGTQSDPMSSTVGDHSKGGKSAKRAAARANPLAGTKPRTNAVEHMRAFLSKRWNPQAAMLDLSVRLHGLSSTRQMPSCRVHALTT